MIYSEEGFQLTRKQLGRLERALDALKRDVLPKNEDRYRLMAEPYEEKIEELRGELQEYQSRLEASAPQATRPGYLRGYPEKSTFLMRVRYVRVA